MKLPVTIAILLACTGVHAADEAITGTIVGDDGGPVGGAFVAIDDVRVEAAPDGTFAIRTPADGPVSLRVGADGHYAMLHTWDRADLAALENDVGRIVIVARKAQRRLLLFAGDAMLARRFFRPPEGESRLVRRSRVFDDGKKVLATIKPYIELADLASVNMETQLSPDKPDNRLRKSVTFYSPPEFAQVLEWAGFDYVALGNNHTWDYQAEGLASTFRALDRTSLGHSGAGLDEAAARRPWTTELGEQPYAFLSYVGWAGTFSPHQAAEGSKGGAALGGSEVFAEDLSALSSGTTTVLQYHSGVEYSQAPAISERMRLREAIDHGADVAIGHHPHVLQGLEIYNNRLIAYSMGNFLFDQTYYTTKLGMLLYVWMDGDEMYRAEVVPMYVNGYVPTPATGAMHYSILHRVARLSRPLGTCLGPNGAHAVIVACDAANVQRVDLGAAKPGTGPIPLALMRLDPTRAARFSLDGYQYRVGTDILPHGDFESLGLFGAPERGWIVDRHVSIADGESRHLEVRVPEGQAVRAGMNVFQKVFTMSNPTTLSGRVYTDGPAIIRFQLQRRRIGKSTSDELAGGPTRAVGGLQVQEAGWHRFAIDFDQPRIATYALRLLIDVGDDPDVAGGVEARFDDLAWIEWHTPWMGGNSLNSDGKFATHVQFRPVP